MSANAFRSTIRERGPDYAKPGNWNRTILLCFAPRCGSNLLARSMWRTGVLGEPREYFNYDAEMFGRIKMYDSNNLPQYIAKLIEATKSPNGVFSTKLLPGHWNMIQASQSHDMLDDADTILITRRDVVAQAVSFAIASHTQAWTSERSYIDDGTLVYDYANILGKLRFIESTYEFWAKELGRRGKRTMMYVYEDFQDDAEAVARRIASIYKVPPSPSGHDPQAKLVEKQATERNDEWIARFRADMKAQGHGLAMSPFADHYAKQAAAKASFVARAPL